MRYSFVTTTRFGHKMVQNFVGTCTHSTIIVLVRNFGCMDLTIVTVFALQNMTFQIIIYDHGS